MAIYSAAKKEEQREEAIKLFISCIHLPITLAEQGIDVAKQVANGAEVLLKYIQTGKTD